MMEVRNSSIRTAPPVRVSAVVLGLVAASACLDSTDPPARSPQAAVNFPEELFLAGPNDRGFCTGLFSVSTTQADTLGILQALDGVAQPPTLDSVPHNCFVEVATASIAPVLPVDVHEVTNEQFQLCVDSEGCRGPDPSEVTKEDVCSSEDDFDACPMVSVTQEQAADYCEWVGRRLPSGFEHALLRQAGIPTSTATGLPVSVPLLPTGDTLPVDCGQAVLGNGSCDRPFPIEGRGNGGAGAAPGDAVNVLPTKGTGVIYDLVGNVAELLADLAPDQRGTADGLPWFCVADLPDRATGTPFSRDNPPRCPEGQACVRGRYRPAPDLPIRDDWPVCITAGQRPLPGFRPVLVGASYFERLVETAAGADGIRVLEAREAAGVFARRVLSTEEPNRLGNTQIGRRTGFRCVGQRPSGTDSIAPPDFEDRLIVRLRP